jgi:hypothetical protein
MMAQQGIFWPGRKNDGSARNIMVQQEILPRQAAVAGIGPGTKKFKKIHQI